MNYKIYFTAFLLFLFAIINGSNAQAPAGMNYQAVARDAGGSILPNQNIALRITITDGSGGSTVYRETQNATTNQFGLFTLNIGDGTVLVGTFSTISWKSINAWMRIEMDITGGTNYILMGNSELLSVPYSLHSEYADKNGEWETNGNDISNLNSGNVGIGTTSPDAKLDINGTFRLKDGTEGAGKILESDQDGNANWKNVKVAFMATCSNNLSVPTTQVNIINNNIVFNDGNGYNATTGIFTAPDSGVYHFDFLIEFNAAVVTTGYIAVGFSTNLPSSYLALCDATPSSISYWSGKSSCTVKLEAGDTIFPLVNNVSSTTLATDGSTNYNQFSGYKVY